MARGRWYDFEAHVGGNGDDLIAMAAAAGGKSEIKPIPLINISNWDNEPVPEPEYSVPDRIPVGHTTLFSGEGAAGKSTIGLQLCARRMRWGAYGSARRHGRGQHCSSTRRMAKASSING